MKKILFTCLISGLFSMTAAQSPVPNYLDPDLPVEVRVKDIIARLTLEEKVLLMKYDSPAVERLNIPAYNWWNEALHGVARTEEKVTVFPQPIGMAASFDREAVQNMGDIASTEGRAIFNEDFKNGQTGGVRYRGLTYWTPNINIFRDPRWGRGHETYGEDPYLSAIMGDAMVRGLEGDDPKYLKSAACAKHYAVHSGPEYNRHTFDARTNAYDLWDTYLPAFRHLVTKSKVHGVMCAYNRHEGQPCCGSNKLLADILRNQWLFDGYVTSDCWAVSDFASNHKTHANDVIAVSDAVLSGTDLECGNQYQLLVQAVNQGLITEREINVSLTRLFTILFKLGMYDPVDRVPYTSIGRDVLECEEHRQAAYEAAQKSMVLLENKRNTLPLDAGKIKRIMVVGPNADDKKVLYGNYHGIPSITVTPYESLQARYGDRIRIDYIQGTGIVDRLKDNAPSFSQIAKKAKNADVILFVGGINADYEGESGDAGIGNPPGFRGGDRTSIKLPEVQTELLKELKKTGRPVIVVNMSGSIMSFEWESQNVDAILQAWYGGQAAGDAIVDVLFGDYNPAGRMPLTTYESDEDLPHFEDYSMSNRTYRYFKGQVMYPFGYGLSYTTFTYGPVENIPELNTGEKIEVSATVTNTGHRDGDEVVQLYVIHSERGGEHMPICALKGFERIHLRRGESRTVKFTLSPEELALVNNDGNLIEKAGVIEIYIGGGQPYKSNGKFSDLTIKGEPYQVF